MEYLAVGSHLEWQTEKPRLNEIRQSDAFTFLDRVFSLKLTATGSGGDKKYELKILFHTVMHKFRVFDTTVYPETNNGILFPMKYRINDFYGSEHIIWSSVIKHHGHSSLDTLDCDGCTSLKFVIVFLEIGSRFGKSLPLVSKKDDVLPSYEKSVQTPLFLSPTSCFESLSKDYLKLLQESPSYDIKLKCGEHTVGAHKIILSSRSQVFAKMLQSDMAESRTDVVEIQDMDREILELFLRYLYTGTLPEMNMGTASSFYEAADKYAVEGLFRKCSDFLADNLTQDNAFEILVLADAHNDQQLKERAIVYMVGKEISLEDDCFLNFSSSHPTLANEVLIRLCKKLQKSKLNF